MRTGCYNLLCRTVGMVTMEILKKVLRNPMLWVAIIYLIVPVDLVPDAVPVIGTLDDLLPFIVSMIVQEKMSKNTK